MATAVLLLALGLTAPANASGRTARQITASVLGSANPQAAYASLNAHDRAVFQKSFTHQSSVTKVNRGGAYVPTAADRLAMIRAGVSPDAASVSGCWYRYWYKEWSDLGLHDGDSWMQLNWCGSGGSITSWSQTNYGCDGHLGASCSPQGQAHLNVGWEIRSTRYFKADFFGFTNSFCMQIRGGATGLYSENSSASGGCSLN